MTDLNNLETHSRSITAFFDGRAAAEKAISDLEAAGIPRTFITLTEGRSGTAATNRAGTMEDKGFWDSLKDLFLPEEDRYAYAEGLNRGGFLLTVRADEANYNRVLDILDTDGAIDMDQRESQWRSEGWSGFSNDSASGYDTTAATGLTGAAAGLGAASTAGLAGTTAASTKRTDYQTTNTTALGATNASLGATGTANRLDANRDEVIPVYEENLRVGKRDVSHGRIRLRSYVVETPVSEQVSLHNESVTIDRKAVDRPVTGTEALFQDRVIEAEERAEEAVIAKDVRVKEEITLRKTAEDRTQTVSDSVRHTEVEIDDQRNTGMTGTGTRFMAATDSARITEHMPVISADGQTIGTVDHLDGPDRIKLTKTASPDHQHHFVPFAWIDHVDQHVHLNKTLADIKAGL